eukprot:2327023-Pleurochrysis_carterae.AAC.1
MPPGGGQACWRAAIMLSYAPDAKRHDRSPWHTLSICHWGTLGYLHCVKQLQKNTRTMIALAAIQVLPIV